MKKLLSQVEMIIISWITSVDSSDTIDTVKRVSLYMYTFVLVNEKCNICIDDLQRISYSKVKVRKTKRARTEHGGRDRTEFVNIGGILPEHDYKS